MKDLPERFRVKAELIADDTSLLSVVNDVALLENHLNEDWIKVYSWPYEWRISFNLDLWKWTQEAILAVKLIDHYILY